MCNHCNTTRRGFLTLAAGAGAAMWAGRGFAEAPGVSPDEALARLKSGNAKYVSAPELCLADPKAARGRVAKSQTPFACILTCADSRVTPETIFGDIQPGELFVARNAGNVPDTDVLGSFEYAVEHLGARLLVVMGHQRCGAVAAACDVAAKGVTLPGAIAKLVDNIVPAAKAVQGKDGDFLDNAVRENARRGADRVRADSGYLAEQERSGRIKIVCARYDLDGGMVDFLA